MKVGMQKLSDKNLSDIISWDALLTECIVFFCLPLSWSYSKAIYFPILSFPALKVFSFVLN